MDNPKENDQYKLFIDAFNYIVLSVSFVESNVVWLKQDITTPDVWKYDRKKERLYKWVGDGYDAVDIQYGFSRMPPDGKSSDDLWKERQQQGVDYAGFYGD